MGKGLGFRASGRAHIPRVCAKLGAFYSRQEAIVQGADPAADEERMGEDDLMIVSFVESPRPYWVHRVFIRNVLMGLVRVRHAAVQSINKTQNV